MARTRPRISPDDTLMTHKATAAYASLSTHYLYELGSAGVGPPRHRVGTRWYYLRSEVDAWLLSEPDLSAAHERQRAWRRQKAAEA